MDCKKFSRAGYPKTLKEKTQKFTDVLSRTKKIDKYFIFQMLVQKLP